MTKRLFKRIRQDTCPSCGKDRSLYLYTATNYKINFPLILDTENYDTIDNTELYYAKCDNCGKEFKLDWRNDERIPIVLSDISSLIYLQQYSKSMNPT